MWDNELGSALWTNWQAFDTGLEEQGWWEAAIYTDAEINGNIISNLGPYQLFNTVAHANRPNYALRLGVVLRISARLWHGATLPDASDPDTDEAWTGLNADDEMAAVLSLICHARFRSGGMIRQNLEEDDPRGRPFEFDHVAPSITWKQQFGSLLPDCFGIVELDAHVDRLRKYRSLTWEDSVTLARAALRYANALWYVDVDPTFSWLELVSAVEIVASRWGSDAIDYREELKRIYPGLVKDILADANGQLLDKVANRLKGLIGSTARFKDFLLTYDPGPPSVRPEFETERVDWDHLDAALRQVYGYRSNALHSGIPFPSPLCITHPSSGSVRVEKPAAQGYMAAGGKWPAEGLPMTIEMFAYIVRGAILNWWDAAVAEENRDLAAS